MMCLYNLKRELCLNSQHVPSQIGLCQGCILSPLLFVMFSIWRHSHEEEGVGFWKLQGLVFSFADYAVLFPMTFGVYWDGSQPSDSSCKYEVMVFHWTDVKYSLLVGFSLCFKQRSSSFLKWKMDQHIDVFAPKRALLCSVIVKKDLIYWFICVPTLTLGHDV